MEKESERIRLNIIAFNQSYKLRSKHQVSTNINLATRDIKSAELGG